MPQFRRLCIYCGVPSVTQEHLYAKWLRPHIPSKVDMHGIRKTILDPISHSEKVDMRMGDTHSRRIRRVCRECNGGWMSELQQAAKPYLVPMIAGHPTILSRQAQRTLSAWAAMFTMTSEFIDDEFSAVPQSDRDYLRANSRTPKGWRVWIGRYQWEKGVERWTHNVMCLGKKGEQGPAGDTSHPMNTQTTTVCVGDHLFFHLMGSGVDSGQSIIRKWGFGPMATALQQIGPAAAEKVRWPPTRTLSRRGLFAISNALFLAMSREMLKQTAHMRR